MHKEPTATEEETLFASLDLEYAEASRRYTARRMIRFLEQSEFILECASSSHFIFYHPSIEAVGSSAPTESWHSKGNASLLLARSGIFTR